MAPLVKRRRASLLALGIGVPIALLLVLSQALLPSLAAQRIRDHIARYGTVRHVHVSAFPAVKLLWGHADSVAVTAGALALTPAQIASLLREAHGVAHMTVAASVADLRVTGLPSGLSVKEVRLDKRGSAIRASATLTQRRLDEAVPGGFRIQPLAGGGGQVRVRASGGFFGLQASIGVLVRPLSGRLVAEPQGLPLASLASVTLYSDPRLAVDSVGLRVLRSEPLAYGLSLSATLR
jgi:hypothetical protein